MQVFEMVISLFLKIGNTYHMYHHEIDFWQITGKNTNFLLRAVRSDVSLSKMKLHNNEWIHLVAWLTFHRAPTVCLPVQSEVCGDYISTVW